MDDARQTLLAVASSLGRLQVRMLRLSSQQLVASEGRLARVARNHWTVKDLSPPSEWLVTTPARTSLCGAMSAVALAQVHLLSMIEADGPIDRRQACRVVSHISCGGGWSPISLRLAAHLVVSLASSPLEETHGANLHRLALLPRRKRPVDWESWRSPLRATRIAECHLCSLPETSAQGRKRIITVRIWFIGPARRTLRWSGTCPKRWLLILEHRSHRSEEPPSSNAMVGDRFPTPRSTPIHPEGRHVLPEPTPNRCRRRVLRADLKSCVSLGSPRV